MADKKGDGLDVVPRVLQLLLNFLCHQDLPELLFFNPSSYCALTSRPPFSQTSYHQVKQINLEFAQDVEDKHLIFLKNQP